MEAARRTLPPHALRDIVPDSRTRRQGTRARPGLLAIMIVTLVIGIAVDSLVFGTLERTIRRRLGLLDPAR